MNALFLFLLNFLTAFTRKAFIFKHRNFTDLKIYIKELTTSKLYLNLKNTYKNKVNNKQI